MEQQEETQSEKRYPGYAVVQYPTSLETLKYQLSYNQILDSYREYASENDSPITTGTLDTAAAKLYTVGEKLGKTFLLDSHVCNNMTHQQNPSHPSSLPRTTLCT